MTLRIGVFLVLLASLSGCIRAGMHTQSWVPNTPFRHGYYAYGVGTQGHEVLPPNWVLENYRPENGKLQERRDGDFQYVVEMDFNDDGRIDWRDWYPAFDLSYRNREDVGFIGLRTVPLSSRLGSTSLRVLARMYVEAAAGAGLDVRDLGSSVTVTERRYATRIVDQASFLVKGRPAWRVDFDLIDVDQQRVDPSAVWRRIRMVLINTGFRFAVNGARGAKHYAPTIMVALASNLPEDFEATAGVFDQFLGQLQWTEDLLEAEGADVWSCIGGDQDRLSFNWTTIHETQVLTGTALPPDALSCVNNLVGNERGLRGHALAWMRNQSPESLPTASGTSETPTVTSSDAGASSGDGDDIGDHSAESETGDSSTGSKQGSTSDDGDTHSGAHDTVSTPSPR